MKINIPVLRKKVGKIDARPLIFVNVHYRGIVFPSYICCNDPKSSHPLPLVSEMSLCMTCKLGGSDWTVDLGLPSHH